MSDPRMTRRQTQDLIARKVETLFPKKWIDLDAAHMQVLLHLSGLLSDEADAGTSWDDEADDDLAVDILRQTGVALIRAFSSGVLPTRGIEHLTNSPPILHEPLPLVWWRRVVELDDWIGKSEVFHIGAPPLSVHHLLWDGSRITRALPGKTDTPLTVVTDIEVDAARLDEFAPESADPERQKEALLKMESITRRGKKPDEQRIRIVQRIAKTVVDGRFGSLTAFYEQVVEKYSEHDPDGLNPKQVGRWIFGDK